MNVLKYQSLVCFGRKMCSLTLIFFSIMVGLLMFGILKSVYFKSDPQIATDIPRINSCTDQATHYRPVAEWVPASGGSVPPNAIEVGYDGGDLVYVARAHHQGDNIPGKLVPAHGSCYVAWGGEEHGHHQYEVLVAPYGSSLEWRSCYGSDLPPGAVQGGNTADGEPLYIGRISHEGAMVSGKVHPSHGVLYIPYGGGEHPHSSYEILVVKSVNF